MASTRFKKTPFHFLQYIALQSFCWVLRCLPYSIAVSWTRRIMGWTRFFLPKRFKLVQHNIQLAFPEKSPQEVYGIALESWRNMGGILAEFVKLSHMKPEEFKKHCKVVGFDKALKADFHTGGIIHIGHFTNWEAFGLASSVYGIDKAVLAQRVDNPYVDKEINRLRNIISGRTFYSNHDAKPFFTCMRWLKKKRMLGILFDQNVISAEIWLPFLGRICAWSPITALLAIKMQVPVFPVKVTRDDQGIIVCEILEPLTPPVEYSPQNVRQFTKVLVKYYEQWIKEDPASWLWAHNRWKREKEGLKYLAQHPEENGK